jgi:hypothetical protein
MCLGEINAIQCYMLKMTSVTKCTKITSTYEEKWGFKTRSTSVSVHMAKQFQRRRFFRNQPIRNKNCMWWPCLLTDRDEMSNLHRGHFIDAAYQVSVHLAVSDTGSAHWASSLTSFHLFYIGWRYNKWSFPPKTYRIIMQIMRFKFICIV